MNLFKKILLQKSEKRSLKVYKNLDEFPLKNWIEFQENGDLKLLVKSGKGKASIEDWKKLYDEYLQKYALDSKMKKFLNLQKTYGLLVAKYLQTGNRNIEMESDILKAQIDDFYKDTGSDFDYYKTLYDVELYFKISLDAEKISVSKFFHYLKRIEAINKANQEN